MSKIKVLVFTGYYLPGFKGGGPIKTIKNLIEQTNHEINYKVITGDRDLGDKKRYASILCNRWNRLDSTLVFYASGGMVGLFHICKELRSKCYDVIYLNSFFSLRFSFLPLLISTLLGKKVIIGPRGEFSEGAMSLKKYKKLFFVNFFKLFKLHQKVSFQASSPFEVSDILRVMGESIDIKVAADLSSREYIDKLELRVPGPLKAVFVSRVTPIKNLLIAFQILENVSQPIIYDIYGPIEDLDYWNQCKDAIKLLPLHITVNYKGCLSPDSVIKTMSYYDVFFMPTKGENYSHVLTEAFCAALPVLTADTTPWRQLEQKGIGWDLPLTNLEDFSVILDELAEMQPPEILEIRKNVLAWAKVNFSQPDAVSANVSMFKRVHGQI